MHSWKLMHSPSYSTIRTFILRNFEFFLYYAVHVIQTLVQSFSAYLQFVLSAKLHLPLQNLTIQRVHNDAKLLKKCPKHLSVIISEDTVCITDVADVILWSALIGIPCITFSDKTGYLVKNSSKLRKEYEDKLRNISSVADFHLPSIQLHIGKCSECLVNIFRETFQQHGNGKSSASLDVILTSVQSGRNMLVECARSTSLLLSKHEELLRDFNTDQLDIQYKECSGSISDPDLAICCGPYLSFFGFQPWNMRLTEMLKLPSHRSITYKTFLQLLKKYARCEQRFGT